MLMLHQSQPFFRFIALVTILTFFPSSIAVWNFIPPRWDVVEAEEPANMADPASAAVDTPSAEVPQGLPPKILTQEELAAISGGPARGAAAQAATPRRNHLPEVKIARTLPKSAGAASADSSPAQAEPIQLAQAQPSAVDAALTAADAQWDAGNLADAYLGYVGVLNDYPQATLPGVIDARDRIKDMAKTLDEAGFQTLNAVAADWTTLHGPLAVRGTNEFYRAWAEACKEREDLEGWERHTNTVMERSWRGIVDYAGDIDARRLFSWYLTAANDLDMRIAAEDTMKEFLLQQETSVLAFEGWARLARNAADFHDGAQRIICAANALVYAESVGTVLDNPSELQKEKADLALRLGEMYEALGKLDEALAQYQELQKLYPVPEALASNGNAVYDAGIRAAQIIARMNPNDLYQGILAYSDFIQRYPNGPLVSQARFKMAGLYVLAGDYRQGAQMYQRLVQDDPGQAEQVWPELDFILTYLYDSVEVASGEAVAAAEDVKVAQMCGPSALQRLLKSQGVDVAKEELAALAGTDETGTTLLGLVEAAKAKGIELAGVEAPEAEGLPQPFIAYVNHNHFLVVREVRPDAVVVLDMDKPEATFTRAEFARMWDGKALIRADASSQVAQVLNPEAQKGAKGGCDDGGGGGGGTGGGGTGGGCNPGTGTTDSCGNQIPNPNPCKNAAQVAGAPNANPVVRSSVTSAGIDLAIDTTQTGLVLTETDTSIPIRGAGSLMFRRHYINEKGFHRTEYQGTAKPWMNNIGDGWTHNLNAHLVAAAGSPPSTVSYFAPDGSARAYNWSSSDASYDYYLRSSTGATAEKANVLKRNKSTLKYTLTLGSGATYEFSAATTDIYRSARLESVKDFGNNETTLAYNGAVGTGRLTKVSSPSGDVQHLLLSYSGNLITKVELKSSSSVLQATTYAYNASSQLTKVTDNASRNIEYAYASNAYAPTSRFITKITDKMGRDATLDWTFASYNGSYEAQAIDVTDAGGLTTTYDRSVSTSICSVTTWDGATNLNKVVITPLVGDPTLSVGFDLYTSPSTYESWGYEYTSEGVGGGKNLTRVTRPGGATHAAFTHTSLGRLSTATSAGSSGPVWHYASSGLYPTKITSADGTNTEYFYDGSNRLSRVTHPAFGGNGIQYAYNGYGQIASVTDPLGSTTSYSFDAIGRVTAATNAVSQTTTYDYDPLGQMTRIATPLNRYTYYYYSPSGCDGCGGSAGRLTKIKDALNNETIYEYDGNGNQTRVTDALGHITDFSYDSMNQLTKITSPSGSDRESTLAYDKLGRLSTETNHEGSVTTYSYSFKGENTRISDPVGDLAMFTYDTLGRTSTITNGNGEATALEYDIDGRLTKVTYANSKVTRYLYDSTGRLTKRGAGSSGTIDPTQYYFNTSSGLMTKISYVSGGNTSDVTYYYDANARTTKLTDWINNIQGLQYEFDALGHLTRLVDHDGAYLSYGYDADNNITSMTDYHGNTTSYTYTATNQLSSIVAPGNRVWDCDYNSLGELVQSTLPNGIQSIYEYDERNRLTKLEHRGGGNAICGFLYAIDDNASITRTTFQDDTYWDYRYDSRDRLTKAERRDNSGGLLYRFTYSFDQGDNLVTKSVYNGIDTETSVCFYSAANELTKLSRGGVDIEYAYDLWGRLSARTDGAHTATYNYHYENKLVAAASNFPGETSATYTYGGDLRLRTRDDGSAVSVFRWDRGQIPISEETSAGLLLKTYVRKSAEILGSSPATGTISYYLRDNIGSVRMLTDANGDSLGEFEYTPYGGVYAHTGVDAPQTFAGCHWDSASHLYVAEHRWYSPEMGQWLSRDPLGLVDGLNPYSYVGGDPVGSSDPSGLIVWNQKHPCKGAIKKMRIRASVDMACNKINKESFYKCMCRWSPDYSGVIARRMQEKCASKEKLEIECPSTSVEQCADNERARGVFNGLKVYLCPPYFEEYTQRERNCIMVHEIAHLGSAARDIEADDAMDCAFTDLNCPRLTPRH